MAKPLERRSAKLLAFFLALIMIGSALAIALRGANTTPKREVKLSFDDFTAVTNLPDTPSEIYYFNFRVNDTNLLNLIQAYAKLVMRDPVFRYVKLTGFDSAAFAYYPKTNSYVYLFNTSSKIFASYDRKMKVGEFDVKVKDFYAFCDQVNPALIGTSDVVFNYLENVGKEKENLLKYVPEKNYAFFRAFQGEIVKQLIRLNDSNITVADFYFEGYALNGSKYEKVVAMNFTSNTFFVEESNVTEEYYVFEKGTLSVAVLIDSNFTKLLEAQPEMRSVIIKMEE
ncbi:conserved hypothetical protein [Ferroglobus placidus DSM 10642]|uniref:Uncharacterized protein n=1 Tax=Ferroglobus placidus (strain DSM 10642 / AEDII12DO) TaxID=589924 RepID=D3RZF1_FERPA|nr:hypothetical protein [Ferroglobus placidus]ADC65864.1 conserved hypothetical protein [Ferroglobus placidus DSM 10642]